MRNLELKTILVLLGFKEEPSDVYTWVMTNSIWQITFVKAHSCCWVLHKKLDSWSSRVAIKNVVKHMQEYTKTRRK